MFISCSRHFRFALGHPVTVALIAALALAACQKTERVPSTAERLKNVEVRQATEPDAYLPRKSVDYMANMKDIKDAPAKADSRVELKAADVAKPAAVPAKAPERAPEVRTAAADPRPATPAPVAPAPVAVEPAKKIEVAKADTSSASQNAYFANLRNYLVGVKRYPTSREARQQRPSGTVHLWVEITRDGKFKDTGIEQTSNFSILDQAALSTVRQGSYTAFPADAWPGQASRRFSMSLDYSLDSGG